jgi:beta-N-acetylhexosaminidase
MIFLPENFGEAYQGVLAAVQNGTISEDRINESLRRVYRVKYANRVEEITAQ